MDDSETYMNTHHVKTDSRSPWRNLLTSTDSELDIGKDEPLVNEYEDPPIASRPGELRVTAQTDGLPPIYSVPNLPRDELLIDDYEDPPCASGRAELPAIRQADAHGQESKVNNGHRPYRQICLLCLVTSALVVTVVGLSIHVSQIRQSKVTSDRNYKELSSTLQSKISEISHLNFSQRTCLKNLSALNSNLSVLKRMHADLRHQFIDMETKYRSVNETKAQICYLLTSRREQTFSQDWLRKEDMCYFISTIERSYDEAKLHCSNSDSNLLEINSTEEENFVTKAVRDQRSSYWIGKCKAWKVASHVVFKMSTGNSECSECKSGLFHNCKNDQHRFICEKSALSCANISEKLKDLCQQSVGPS